MAFSAVGQSFAIIGNKNLGKVKFYIQKTGSPTGKLIARLYEGTVDGFGRIIPNDDPINSNILASSGLIDMDDIDNLYRWEEFIFSAIEQYYLQNGQIYVLQLEIYEGNVDVSNNIHVWGTLDPTCCTGNESCCNNEVWVSYNYDVSMRVYDTEENLLYECDQAGCVGGYAYDTLRAVHPMVEDEDVSGEGFVWIS